MDVDRRATVAGFAGAAAVLAALVGLIGVDRVLAALSSADLAVLPAVAAAAAVWLIAWALALRAVLEALGAPMSTSLSVAVYAGALFANNVTPFGQAGGEPITALLIRRATDAAYETALAAIASADAINLLPSIGFALLGTAYLSVVVALGPELQIAAAVVSGVALALAVGGAAAWRGRARIEAGATRLLAPAARRVGERLPRISAPASEDVEARLDGFFRSIEIVADDRRTLAAALGLSALGWFAQMCTLWLSLYAVGETAPLAAVFVAVPLGALAGVTVLPGGLGGVEAVLVAVLVPIAGVPAATALAAILVHRVAIYWAPTIVGGGVVAALGTDTV